MIDWNWRDRITDGEQLRRLHLLTRVPLFSGLTQRQLGKLLTKLFEKNYAAGEAVFAQGDVAKALFIVLSGTISIVRDDRGTEEPLATLSAGSYFGELALIDDQPRFAGARAAEPTSLLMLYKTDFDALIEGHPTIAIKVMGNLLRTLAGYVRRAQSHENSRHGAITGVVSSKAKSGSSS